MEKTFHILTKSEFRKLFQIISDRLEKQYFILKNTKLGNVAIPYGTFGDITKISSKGGYGLEHIIQSRLEKDNLSVVDICNTIIGICEVVKIGTIFKITDFKCVLFYKTIYAVLVKDHRYSTQTWLLTGFEKITEKKEANDFISSVSDRYKYFREFSRFQTQVGAIASSIKILRKKLK